MSGGFTLRGFFDRLVLVDFSLYLCYNKNMETVKIKRLYTTGRDFETEGGDVLPMADVMPEMEFEEPVLEAVDEYAAVGTTGLARTRGHTRGRRPEISARDMGRIIDEHIAAREKALGRRLTEVEEIKEARFAEAIALGLYD